MEANFTSHSLLLPDWVQNIYLNPEKSKGSYLYDDNSNRSILDLYCFFSTLPLGYNHPIFSTDSFKKDFLSFGGLKPSTGRILTNFVDEFVTDFHNDVNSGIFNKYFFIHGGGLAVENALKISFDWKRHINHKNNFNIESNEMEVIALENAFHGITGYGLSLSDNPLKCSHFPKFNWPKFKAPYVKFPQKEENKYAFHEEQNLALKKIEDYIEQRGKQYISSIIIELIQGGGGDNHLGEHYVKSLKNICKKNDILLIIDEIQTGFGVTGKFWCYEHYNIAPDLITFGKKAQISGVCIGKNIPDIENVINVPGRISPTWNGDISDYIRCKYVMKAYKEYNLIENANELGKYIVSSLEDMKKFSNVRGRGFLIAFDFENSKVRDKYDKLCFKEGLFLLPMRDVTLRMRPNMALTKEEADHALEIICRVNNKIFG
jgi:L-lysine 6-transaminase